MQKECHVLVLDMSEKVNRFKIVAFSETSLPEELNGESSFHIFHVRMLTELILKQLRDTGSCCLTDEEIEDISVASSLHDIGKTKVPKSILDFPGRLSPLEFDIVKKHSAFGADIISDTDCGPISEELRQYAIDIAMHHHERYDGTGYPDGLKGDEIPLSAQVVSIADAYDALTSNRSYKDAISQDVATQMIASGMCGVFNEKLIDALFAVVNNSSLVALREKLSKDRHVVADNTDFVAERVLCVGNTGYLTKEFVETAFQESKVTVMGNRQVSSDVKGKLITLGKHSVEAILETYDFSVVVYFSGDLNFGEKEKNDIEELREVLEAVKQCDKGIRVLFLSTLDTSFKEMTDRAIICSAKERLCEFYAKNHALDIKIVQIPYLYSGTYHNDFLHEIFDCVYSKKTIVLEDDPAAKTYFISLFDLAMLVSRIIDNWKSQSGILSVADEFEIPFSALAEKISQINPQAKFVFESTRKARTLGINNKAIRNEFGWFSRISILEDVGEEYEKFLVLRQEKTVTLGQKIKKYFEAHSVFFNAFELVLLFLVTELLVYLTDSSVIFSIIDFRMAYIVIMATIHGLQFGMYAATFSSIAWLIAKVNSGTNLQTIFYEPTNWLSFIFFFLVGGICGYVKMRKEDTIHFVTAQNKLLEDKLAFTRGVYEDLYKEKRDLKKQILGSKDSFGKILDITKKLDTVSPQLLYFRTLETFEQILETKNTTIYSINKHNVYGRLEVASRDVVNSVPRSIYLDTYHKVIEKLEGGEIFRNIDMEEGLPMYAAGVYRGKELVLLIFIWWVDAEQRSLYYANLFKILRDLVQMSLLRALDYNQAVYEKRYIPNTHIMKAEAFGAELENHKAIAEKKIYSYLLLEIDGKGHSYEELDGILSPKIRTNDILGASEDGGLKLLLSQASEKDLQFILPRFSDVDIEIMIP